MKRILVVLCLVLAVSVSAQNVEKEPNTYEVKHLVMKNKKWFVFHSLVSIPENSPVVERECCQLLIVVDGKSLREYVDHRLRTYDKVLPYSKKKYNELILESRFDGGVGEEVLIVQSKGLAVGQYQTYEIKQRRTGKSLKAGYKRNWTFVYDSKNDKILSVDDVFEPQAAAKLKSNAGDDYINIYVQEGKISCGLTSETGTIGFEALDYIQHEKELTEQFKQAIAFDSLKAKFDEEAIRKMKEMLVDEKDDNDESYIDESGAVVKVFDICEQMPSFPGGQEGLFAYLSKNIRYPAVAEENGIQGRVIVAFFVGKDGSINNVRVVKGVDKSLDNEAIRVVKSMPRWLPGRANGEPVAVKYTVPVTFKLGEITEDTSKSN